MANSNPAHTHRGYYRDLKSIDEVIPAVINAVDFTRGWNDDLDRFMQHGPLAMIVAFPPSPMDWAIAIQHQHRGVRLSQQFIGRMHTERIFGSAQNVVAALRLLRCRILVLARLIILVMQLDIPT